MTDTIRRILLVDDEIEFASTLKRHLKREGFRLDMAHDGIAACQIIEKGSAGDPIKAIDLVITDVIMPNMNGFQLLRWIHEKYSEISVILLTGFGNNDTAFEAIRPEMDAFGKKPITPEKLMAIIRRIDLYRRDAGRRSPEKK
jgi:DNA-binding NtrC family response regulator